MIETRSAVVAERAIIVGLYPSRPEVDPERSLDELASLVEAAGGVVIGRVIQRRDLPTPGTYIGRGKVEEVARVRAGLDADVVIFDAELTPSQIRELEEALGCKVVDRSEVILDIFASRAKTRESHLQVELAQLEYTAPRLPGLWQHLERIGGTGGGVGAGGVAGIGTRGPGEKQIEIDRRIVKSRISRLKSELADIDARKVREVKARTKEHFTVCLVGYTNAGKSTLMNTLTGAGTFAADMLFATLDTKTRRWELERGVEVLLSDTVGFVRNLPHNLVASFKATLEEAIHANLLLHVIDASHPQVESQITAVESVLSELGCDLKNIIPVLNKVDAVEDHSLLRVLEARLPNAVSVSAKSGVGVDKLVAAVIDRRRRHEVHVHITVPVSNGRAQAFVRAHTRVLDERYDAASWHADIVVARMLIDKLYDVGVQIHEPNGSVAITV